MIDMIKSALARALLTQNVCAWLIKTALNAAIAKAKDPVKREDVCAALVSGASLIGQTAKACADGVVTDEESAEIEANGAKFGEVIYKLVKGK